MLRSFIIYLPLFLLVGCFSNNSPKEVPLPIYQPSRSNSCQIFVPRDTAYSFSARVLSVNTVYKYDTAALRNFGIKRLVATTVKVSKGIDLSDNQAIFIDLAPQTTQCALGDVCDFVAPSRNLSANSETLLILDAVIVRKP